MTRLAALPVAALALVAVVSAQGLQKPQFFPVRLTSAELPPLPAPNVAGGGEVLIEALVDRRGAVVRPAIVRATPPYTQFVLDVIPKWQFEPARDIDYKGVETTVDVMVTIAAIYRPPVLMNTPTIGEPPRDWSKPSGEAPFPIATMMPNYPPNAQAGGVVLYEIKLDESGKATEARGFGSIGGFESASREALAGWRFRGALYRARPVPSTVYVLFGFRPPVGLLQPCPVEPPSPSSGKPVVPVPEPRINCTPRTGGVVMLPPSFGILSFR